MQYIRRFSDLSASDVPLVGGKNASLGEMFQALSGEGIKVPDGFATTAGAYWHFLEHNRLKNTIIDALHRLDTRDIKALTTTGKNIREWILNAEWPDDLAQEITASYLSLSQLYGQKNTDVAVRSSATAEDLPTASFAGQQETYLNVQGPDDVLKTCRQVYASLFTNRAISYRVDQGFPHEGVALSIGIQKMVRADLGASGVMFTLDTESGFRDVVLITAAWGLGENVVQGTVNPDEFTVFKPTLAKGFRPVIKRQLGEKAIRMVYEDDATTGSPTKNIPVSPADRQRFSLTDDEVLQLAHYGVTIERHYSEKAGHDRPMDIEWAKDGHTNELFIVQARPETVQSRSNVYRQETYTLKSHGTVVATGKSVGQAIAGGRARLISSATDMHALQAGEILVTDITDPDWEPVMKTATAIVTNRGGRTCHAAIVARELGIPAIVGCGNATEAIKAGQEITVSCAEGDVGYVYKGLLDFIKTQTDVSDIQRPQHTQIMMNVGDPGQAFKFSMLPCDGVGLARLEFIINSGIGIHPNAILEYDSLDQTTRDRIDAMCAGYPDRQAFYINRLAEGIGTIAAAFYPRPVIVRFSDFKSNEYASLIGGAGFEPVEENPMIGFRGAARYFSDQFRQCFKLECQAIKVVRETMGLDNVIVMIPFVRTIDEATSVLELMTEQGLSRGEDGLQIYMMCEIPSNVLLADEFLEYFDGYSIGSNDLTQLTLGIDRDSGIVGSFDERNPAVLKLIKMAIETCHKHKKYIGICGQAPSDYPEMTQWLVQQGIDSISLSPDSVMNMLQLVSDMEETGGR